MDIKTLQRERKKILSIEPLLETYDDVKEYSKDILLWEGLIDEVEHDINKLKTACKEIKSMV